MMSAHITEYITAYLDGELSAAERTEVEAHLAHCAECRTALEKRRHTITQITVLMAQATDDRFLSPHTQGLIKKQAQ